MEVDRGGPQTLVYLCPASLTHGDFVTLEQPTASQPQVRPYLSNHTSSRPRYHPATLLPAKSLIINVHCTPAVQMRLLQALYCSEDSAVLDMSARVLPRLTCSLLSFHAESSTYHPPGALGLSRPDMGFRALCLSLPRRRTVKSWGRASKSV